MGIVEFVRYLSLRLWLLFNSSKRLRSWAFKVIRDYVAIRHQDWFKGGAIRITMCPLCREADRWLGGESNFKMNPPDYAVIAETAPSFLAGPLKLRSTMEKRGTVLQ